MEADLKMTFIQELLKNVVSRCTPVVIYQSPKVLPKKRQYIYLIHLLQERSEASVLCRIIPTATTNQYTGCPLVDTRPKLCMSKTYLHP